MRVRNGVCGEALADSSGNEAVRRAIAFQSIETLASFTSRA